MFGSLRPILFFTELQTPPIKDFSIPKNAARELFNKMHEPGGYRYENLDQQSSIPTLSTRRGEDGNYLASTPITVENLEIVRKNIIDTCRFATDNCKRFLDQFDPNPEVGGGQ